MRHRVKGYQLNRDVKHRRALYKNLISDLINHGQINTTQAKANAVKPAVDKLITHAIAGKLHHRRQIDAFLNNSSLVTRLVKDIAPKYTTRPGGYTKITKLGHRRGDNTMMVRLELLEKTAPSPDTSVKPVKKTTAPEKKSSAKNKVKPQTLKKPQKKAPKAK